MGWVYKFEAYTPAPKRQYGYYALPVLWHDQVVGWANLSVREGELVSNVGYAGKSLARDKCLWCAGRRAAAHGGVPSVKRRMGTYLVLAALMCWSVIGLGFGCFPAHSAAQLDPIQALTAE